MITPVVLRMFDISTGHMTYEDSERLNHHNIHRLPFSVHGYHEGYIINLGNVSLLHIDHDIHLKHFSQAFRNILKYAVEEKFDYIVFDSAGEMYPEDTCNAEKFIEGNNERQGFPMFDW